MPTILEIINLSAEYLGKKEVESPRLNAELLLASVLNTNRIGLYMMFERPLKENEINLYREYIRRRGGREPLQYILGETEFMGLKMKVNPSVLIPRPETELLVEESIRLIAGITAPRILDIGSGSGNIAIALAKLIPEARIISIDRDDSALKVAEENAIYNGAQINVDFLHIDVNVLEGQIESGLDMIVSNPPYVSKDDYSGLQTEVRDFEPSYAVTDNADGLSFYRVIAEKSVRLLKPGGKIALEFAMGQAEEISGILQEHNFTDLKILKDLAGIDRIITGVLV